jgi:hypothetical protein
MAPLILKLGTRRRWVVKCTPGRFTPGKKRRYPLNKMLGGLQTQYGCFWRGISLSSTWIRSPDHWSCRTVPTPGLANLWHAAFTTVPFLFFLPDQLLYIVTNMCTNTQSDCAQTVYELLLPNNTAIETFLYKSRAVQSTEWGPDLAVTGRIRDNGKNVLKYIFSNRK